MSEPRGFLFAGSTPITSLYALRLPASSVMALIAVLYRTLFCFITIPQSVLTHWVPGNALSHKLRTPGYIVTSRLVVDDIGNVDFAIVAVYAVSLGKRMHPFNILYSNLAIVTASPRPTASALKSKVV